MTTYRITNTTSGLHIGDYEASSAEEAGVAMLRDAGYADATADDLDSDLEIVEAPKPVAYQVITSKGRKSAGTLEAIAAWLLEMQPSSTRIVWGDVEAEVEWADRDCEQDLRWALRLEEAAGLDLTVNNNNIYLTRVDDSHPIYLRADVACVTLVDNRNMISREIRDDETLADLVDAV